MKFWSIDFCFFATTSTNVIPLWNLASTQNIGQSLPPIFFRIFRIFLDFTVHAKIIWAKTEMGTGQHFFHECKWHAHIGDAFLNILISYLNFSELVWIFYEVFKVMVKRSKGKSIRGAKWFGQEQVFSETRGKPAECDPTRGIKSIIPFDKVNIGIKSILARHVI